MISLSLSGGMLNGYCSQLKKSFVLVFSLLIYIDAVAQPPYPEIGVECPDFVIEGVQYYPSSVVAKDDLVGQFTILEFWDKHCGACIASMPKTDKIQRAFQDSLQIFLVASEDKSGATKKLFEKVRVMHSLSLASAFDPVLAKRFVPKFVPHLIWIDKDGIVVAITGTSDLTEENVRLFLAGKPFEFTDESYNAISSSSIASKRREVSVDEPSSRDGGTYLLKSNIEKWKKGMPVFFTASLDSYPLRGTLEYYRVPLMVLYNLAFWGAPRPPSTVFSETILEIRDSSAFQYSYANKGTGLYSYSLSIPKARYSKATAMRAIRDDLAAVFPYVARIERRVLPCYVLTVFDRSKLRRIHNSDTSKESNWDKFSGGVLVNYPFSEFLELIGKRLPENRRIVDETGVQGKVTLSIDAYLEDVEAINRALQYYGISLQEKERTLEVLVIADE